MKLSRSTARRLILHAQGLDDRWKLPRGKNGTATAVERLGYVQIDTISVVQRAHHHILWTRHSDYVPDQLDQLLARDRRVFEYWTHAASYVPFGDYRYYLPRMRSAADWPRNKKWRAENGRLLKEVLQRVTQEGALGSADFDHRPGERGSWWGWKPAKRALEILFDSGELLVTARRRFQRLYDLPERVIPAEVDTAEPPAAEAIRFLLRRAIAAHGLAPFGQFGWGLGRSPAVKEALHSLTEAGEVTEVTVEGRAEPHYALAAFADIPRRVPNRVHILSPFDSLVIHRRRLHSLFDFDYKIECYTPAPQRRYGYFTLPILWGDRLVGRLDPKAERKTRRLLLRNVVFEPGFDDIDALFPRLAQTLRAFATFNECDEIVLEKCAPTRLRAPLRRALG